MAVVSAPIYHAYAPIYDAIEQGRFSVRMTAWTLGWLAAHGARPKRVLDLACGTGEAALVFAEAGCAVAGVDQSAAMLEIARGKARDAGHHVAFVQADIRDLPANEDKDRGLRIEDRSVTEDGLLSSILYPPSSDSSSFDLVTCFYDSLNYLTEDGDLDRVFAAVAKLVRAGGYMVFDMNTAAEYATWAERDAVTHDGRGCLVYNKLSYDPAARLATGRIVWFVRETERWWRGEEVHAERAWGDAEVRAALARGGLELVGRYDVEGNNAAEDAARVVYVARRLNEE